LKRKHSNDENTSEVYLPEKIKRFGLVGVEEDNLWQHPDNMVEYVHRYLATFIPERKRT